MIKEYIKQSLIAIDQGINAIVCFGMADETLSARAWRERNKSKPWHILQVTVDWVALHIFRVREHCKKAWWSEFDKHQLPEAYRMKRKEAVIEELWDGDDTAI